MMLCGTQPEMLIILYSVNGKAPQEIEDWRHEQQDRKVLLIFFYRTFFINLSIQLVVVIKKKTGCKIRVCPVFQNMSMKSIPPI